MYLFGKYFRWSSPTVHFSGSVGERIGDRLKLTELVSRQISSLRKILSQQPIGRSVDERCDRWRQLATRAWLICGGASLVAVAVVGVLICVG